MKQTLLLAAVLALLLTGCNRMEGNNYPPPRLVTRICVSFDDGTVRLRRVYEDEEKMRWVLQYLRQLDRQATEDAPPPAAGEWAQIEIRFSDGSQERYQQWGLGFFRRGSEPWESIDPEQARELPLLLGMMESDEP